jgi:hypothetical protein
MPSVARKLWPLSATPSARHNRSTIPPRGTVLTAACFTGCTDWQTLRHTFRPAQPLKLPLHAPHRYSARHPCQHIAPALRQSPQRLNLCRTRLTTRATTLPQPRNARRYAAISSYSRAGGYANAEEFWLAAGATEAEQEQGPGISRPQRAPARTREQRGTLLLPLCPVTWLGSKMETSGTYQNRYLTEVQRWAR